jgi:molybdenum cofactor cytidylyltransferase
MTPSRSVGAILLAAGGSRRLGRPKQLVPFRGEALVRRAARIAVEADLSPVVVVIAPGAGAVREALAGLPVELVENALAAAGVGTSVTAGVARLQAIAPSVSGVVLLVCDQPLLESDHLRALLARREATNLPVIASEYEGVLGVPALFGAEVLGELGALEGDIGARQVIRRDPARVAAVAFPQGALDVDEEQDVRAARSRG